ncbi:MAG: DNA polymerase III subunit delta [Clostridia bacterium]|nr:DNA polymerase III subunit delta [Clostridia bacterium]
MPLTGEKELKKMIKPGITGAFLLYGSEKYLVKHYCTKLTEAAVDEAFADFNFTVFEGDGYTLDEVYDACLAVPVMAETKCVLVKDYNTDTMTESELSALETILKENPEECCLIFSYSASEPKEKNFKKAAKLFEIYGFSVDFPSLSLSDLSSIAERGAKSRGKSFAPGAASHMVDSVGYDLNMISNELDKLCAYVSGDVIKKADIDAICIKTLETKVFDMIKDLVSGRIDDAFHKLSYLFEQRNEPTLILGALVSQYSDMYRCKALKEAGKSNADIMEYYPAYKKAAFKIDKAAKAASKLTMKQMRMCIEILAEADLALKRSSNNQREILEKTLVRLALSDRN